VTDPQLASYTSKPNQCGFKKT